MNYKLITLCFILSQSIAHAQCPDQPNPIKKFINENVLLTPLHSLIGQLESYHQQQPDCKWEAEIEQLIQSTGYKYAGYSEQDKVCSVTKQLLPHYHTRLNALWALSCDMGSCEEEAENLFNDYPFIRVDHQKLYIIEDNTSNTITREYDGQHTVNYINLKHRSLNELCGNANQQFLFIGDYPKDKNSTANKLIDTTLDKSDAAAKYDQHKATQNIRNKFNEAYFLLDQKDNLLYLNDEILSMRHDLYQYTGGAHGNANKVLYSFNLVDNKQIKLNDIINPELKVKFIEYARSTFKKQNFGEGKQDWESQEFWFNADKIPAEHKEWSLEDGFYLNNNFALIDNGIIFMYQPYEVSPWSRGVPKLILDKKAISSYLKDTSFINSWKIK